MAALTAERKATTQRGSDPLVGEHDAPMDASVTVFAGALVVLAGGYARPGRTATGDIALGVAQETKTNGAVQGANVVRVRRGVFKFANSSAGDLIAQANVGAECFVVDDQTVALTNGGSTRSRAGKIVAVDSAGVEVQIGLGV